MKGYPAVVNKKKKKSYKFKTEWDIKMYFRLSFAYYGDNSIARCRECGYKTLLSLTEVFPGIMSS